MNTVSEVALVKTVKTVSGRILKMHYLHLKIFMLKAPAALRYDGFKSSMIVVTHG